MWTYITTTIPYVNARPHIGFALELVQADALARYRRLRGETVRLQTGTDENAWKNVESARAQGCSPQDFVDRNTAAFRELANNLGNLVSRLTTLAQRSGLRWHAPAGEPVAPAGFHEAWQEYAFDRALGVFFEKLTAINQEIGVAEPWRALKAGNFTALHAQLPAWLTELSGVAYWLAPFLPETARKITDILVTDPLTAAPSLFPRV